MKRSGGEAPRSHSAWRGHDSVAADAVERCIVSFGRGELPLSEQDIQAHA
jgi:hypothetical protein